MAKAIWKAEYNGGKIKYYCDQCWRGIHKHTIELINKIPEDTAIECSKCSEKAQQEMTR